MLTYHHLKQFCNQLMCMLYVQEFTTKNTVNPLLTPPVSGHLPLQADTKLPSQQLLKLPKVGTHQWTWTPILRSTELTKITSLMSTADRKMVIDKLYESLLALKFTMTFQMTLPRNNFTLHFVYTDKNNNMYDAKTLIRRHDFHTLPLWHFVPFNLQ